MGSLFESKSETEYMDPVNRKLRPAFNALAAQMTEGIKSGQTVYPGAMTAALTPEMLRAREMMTGFDPQAMRSQQFTALESLLSGEAVGEISSSELNRYFDKSVAAPAMRAWDADIAPRMRDEFARTGGLLSSRRGQVMGQELGRMQADIEGQRAAMQGQALFHNLGMEESAENRRMQSFGLADQYRNAPLMSAMGFQQAAAPYQTFEQQLAQEGYAKWAAGQPFGSPYVGPLTQLMAPTKPDYVTTQSPTPFSQIMGGIGAVTGGLGMMGYNPFSPRIPNNSYSTYGGGQGFADSWI